MRLAALSLAFIVICVAVAGLASCTKAVPSQSGHQFTCTLAKE